MVSRFTEAGLTLFAAWEADPALKRKIRFIAFGDLTPEQYANASLYNGSETELHNQKYFGPVQRVYTESAQPTVAVAEAKPDFAVRGWSIREVGVFVEGAAPEDDPVLVWISHHPETFIPDGYDNMIVGELISVPIKFGTAEVIEIFTDNAALVNWDDFLGQAAEEGLRDLNLAHETALIKNYIFGG